MVSINDKAYHGMERHLSLVPCHPWLCRCAAIDLSMLPLLGEVRGYWNIVDYLQQVRGQLLVSVHPDDTLLAQLQAARARGPATSYTALPGRGVGWSSGACSLSCPLPSWTSSHTHASHIRAVLLRGRCSSQPHARTTCGQGWCSYRHL